MAAAPPPPCPSMMHGGRCHHGSRCKFSHNPRYKTSMCPNTALCPNGAACPFAHSHEELRCKDGLACTRRNDKCRKWHPGFMKGDRVILQSSSSEFKTKTPSGRIEETYEDATCCIHLDQPELGSSFTQIEICRQHFWMRDGNKHPSLCKLHTKQLVDRQTIHGGPAAFQHGCYVLARPLSLCLEASPVTK